MSKKRIIEGIVVPHSWDDNGKITSIAVSTAGETEYIVTMDRQGKNLLGAINQRVRAELTQDNQRSSVKILCYDIIDWA